MADQEPVARIKRVARTDAEIEHIAGIGPKELFRLPADL
jgi:hypothetical protein